MFKGRKGVGGCGEMELCWEVGKRQCIGWFRCGLVYSARWCRGVNCLVRSGIKPCQCEEIYISHHLFEWSSASEMD